MTDDWASRIITGDCLSDAENRRSERTLRQSVHRRRSQRCRQHTALSVDLDAGDSVSDGVVAVSCDDGDVHSVGLRLGGSVCQGEYSGVRVNVKLLRIVVGTNVTSQETEQPTDRVAGVRVLDRIAERLVAARHRAVEVI